MIDYRKKGEKGQTMAISRKYGKTTSNWWWIMTLDEPRQGYFLGKIVKKAKRAVKKVVKSPLGKLH